MKLPVLLFGVALLPSLALAQSTTVVPAGMANSNTGSTTLAWTRSTFRFQMLYDESHFLSQGIDYPIQITRIKYRAAGGATSPGGETYTGVSVDMSSSPSDWSNPSTTFAANVGTDNTQVFNGSVTATAATGGSPNDYIIDIQLTTPFTYDPTSNLDLLVDVTAPNPPSAATVPSFAASSSATDMARRVSSSNPASATGSLSSFALVMMLDFNPVNAATATKFGQGCMSGAVSFYETFNVGGFDLGGTATTTNSILLTPTGSGYAVSNGNNSWFTPTSADLGLADDALSTPQTLPFTFLFPGGSTTDILVGSNGYVYLDTTQTSTTSVGDAMRLLTGGARLAPLWHDMNPATGGSVHFDVDPANNAVYVTWLQVPHFDNAQNLTTMQLAIFSDGRVEYRYRDVANGAGLTGWSPGGGARDDGGLDISTELPFITEPDLDPLVLEPISRPRLGGVLQLELRNIPSSTRIAAINFGLARLNPPVDLGIIGMTTCHMYASLEAYALLTPSGSTQTYQLNIPNDTRLQGNHLYAWSVATAPGYNALGLITSNAVDLLFDVN